jgi:hypothetical protein
MARIELRELARKLRRSGKSIRNISDILDANKSSVSNWCRDIALSSVQQKKLLQTQRETAIRTLSKSSELRREIRIQSTKKEFARGAKNVGSVNKRDLFIAGLALYWGEGYKKGNEELGFTNSDPRIIRIFIRWMHDIYGTRSQDYILRVTINSLHRQRIENIESYWSNITGLPKKQFTKPALVAVKANKIFKNPQQYFGTLRIKVRRATSLRRRILGSISELSRKIEKTM